MDNRAIFRDPTGARYVRVTFREAGDGKQRKIWAVTLPQSDSGRRLFARVDKWGDRMSEFIIGEASDFTTEPAGISLQYGWMIAL